MTPKPPLNPGRRLDALRSIGGDGARDQDYYIAQRISRATLGYLARRDFIKRPAQIQIGGGWPVALTEKGRDALALAHPQSGS